jgi:hypothetical protein
MNMEKDVDLGLWKDPDFRLKNLEEFNMDKFTITCSRCHHCRK